ncbi:hypothetical protein [Kutzneria sp. 744]|uniref:hypothetical protein n=1 Tax=Kutzneria sp. (strain 744) TaxID=345341 RepID=UPI0012FCD384|nr:hypothetical protein [Kutzneria sp. 744]
MELFVTKPRVLREVTEVPGISPADLAALLSARRPHDRQPILLDEQMRPVEPISTWFRILALASRDAKTMLDYAYIGRRLLLFLNHRGDGPAAGWQTRANRRSADQGQPVEGGTGQPGHDESRPRRANRVGQANRRDRVSYAG